ncbi:MAG: helix-turn-helix domain-containing protein [Firmicutes bacterium]|nr:helix-turn-helix domain-containing protein [Bacillota bacterium]
MRFGDYIKQKRLQHPDELTLKEVSKMLGISLSFLSDVENNRRKPFDKNKIEMLAAKLGLTAEEKATMFDLAARGRKEVPSDIEDVMMYSEVGKMARLALRKTNTGEITEEDWKQFIRKKKQKQD